MQFDPVETGIMRQLCAEDKAVRDVIDVSESHGTGSRESDLIRQPGEPTSRSTTSESKSAWREGRNKRGSAANNDGRLSPCVRYLHDNESTGSRCSLAFQRVLLRDGAHGTCKRFIGTQGVRGDGLRDDHIPPKRQVITR